MTGNGPSFELSEEHEMIRQAARDFALKEIAPIAGIRRNRRFSI